MLCSIIIAYYLSLSHFENLMQTFKRALDLTNKYRGVKGLVICFSNCSERNLHKRQIEMAMEYTN